MQSLSYRHRRSELELYFDRTAADAWSRLTSDAPVGRIRATVRAGRDRMRASLLACLPDELTGRRVLDAGCGTGALAVEAARRGAEVVAIDLSATLVNLARQRQPYIAGPGSLDFQVGDMLDPALGRFDHVVAMDSLIHYTGPDMVGILAGLAARTERSLLLTFAPKTPLLAAMHGVGRLFPRGDRAPAIEPIGARALLRRIAREPNLASWQPGRSTRISGGFYISQMLEVVRR
jgi:magnesium-protoporphyrin O-methyltransferase